MTLAEITAHLAPLAIRVDDCGRGTIRLTDSGSGTYIGHRLVAGYSLRADGAIAYAPVRS